MKKQTHHIQKQLLLLDFSSEEKARRWHKAAPAIYHSKILPSLSHMLDKIVPADHHYVIERLDIDLHQIEEEKLPEAALKEIASALHRLLKIPPARRVVPKPRNIPKEGKRPEETFFMKDNQAHLIESLYYFLDHGILPWSSPFKNLAVLETAIIEKTGLERLTTFPGFQQRLNQRSTRKRLYLQFSSSLWQHVCLRNYQPEITLLNDLRTEILPHLALLAKNRVAREQLTQKLSGNIEDWIGLAAPSAAGDWAGHYIRGMVTASLPYVKPAGEAGILKALAKQVSLGSKGRGKHTALLSSAIQALITLHQAETVPMRDQEAGIKGQSPPAAPSDPTVTEKTKQPPEREKKDTPEKAQPGDKRYKTPQAGQASANDKPGTTPPAPGPGDQGAGQAEKPPGEAASTASKEWPEGQAATAGRPFPSGQQAEEKSGGPQREAKAERPPIQKIKQEEDGHSDEGIASGPAPAEYYLRHAGIILTWPYLARLFDHLAYLDNHLFKDRGHQERAVHLLGYVASGLEQCEEYELVMAKFLCAWPLEAPIVKALQLTGPEKAEADRMLGSLINNWRILKNTSLEGLRSSFFDRDGKLFKEEEQWRLIVAQKSYDMLLDHLPYALSVIRLPWMKATLKVDWA